MNRRQFINRGIGAGVVVGTSFLLGKEHPFYSPSASTPTIPYDLVAVKGGEPELMFDKAIESFGGMKQFVSKGQSVLVKPNIGWDAVPERGADTNPKLVGRIIEHCFNAGAKEVFVFDHTCEYWVKCYKNSGIERQPKMPALKLSPGKLKDTTRKSLSLTGSL